MSFTAVDHLHMAHALRLAAHGLYGTQPNPRVGCVIAHGETVVGTGWHRRAGGPHAEVFALGEAGGRARGATAYVTLEPCAHHGRTPPCADALVAAGVTRVVVAAEDPFPQVAGRGMEKLRAAGIVVDHGLMRDEARELNVGFFSRIERGRPFVRVKLAMSLDGRTALADGSSKWITGAAARDDVQRWRARSSAILTGVGTLLADDPRLTVRLPEDVPFAAPTRVVLDSRLRTPATAVLFNDSASPVQLVSLPGTRDAQHDALAARGATFTEVPAAADGRPDLGVLLDMLGRQDINELHVEAGPTLCGALFAQGLVDELLLYIAPVLLGSTARPLLELPPLADMAERWQLRVLDRRQLGDDTRLRLRPH